MRFEGKLILVVGGASGIGATCSTFFAQRGGRVIVADKNMAAARIVAADNGGEPVFIDIGDEESVNEAASAVQTRFGDVDVLVNSAGVLQRTLPPSELSMKEWDLVQQIDLRGTYLSCRALGGYMVKRRRGAIVNIASVAGMRSGPLHSYGPAKAGVISLTECLAAEWGRAGVRVNAVSPGFTRTPALRKGIETHLLDVDEMSAASAIGRLLEPEEIAAAVAFLASDLASGITGINLAVDLGYLVATPWLSYGGVRQRPE